MERTSKPSAYCRGLCVQRSLLRRVAYPGGFEPLTFGVGVQRSIQLSYGYNMHILAHFLSLGKTLRDAIF